MERTGRQIRRLKFNIMVCLNKVMTIKMGNKKVNPKSGLEVQTTVLAHRFLVVWCTVREKKKRKINDAPKF